MESLKHLVCKTHKSGRKDWYYHNSTREILVRVMYKDGFDIWFDKDGKRHKTDGPAIIRQSKEHIIHEYYTHGSFVKTLTYTLDGKLIMEETNIQYMERIREIKL